MKEIILKNLGGKKVLFFFTLSSSIYFFMVFVSIPYVMKFSGGKKLLDMLPTGYDPVYVASLFEVLGKDGRGAYLYNQLPVDMVYPFLFAVSSCLVIGYFLNKINKFKGFFVYLCFIPIFTAIFDYGENVGIILMLKTYPNSIDLLVKVSSAFSVLKSFSTVSYFLALTAVLSVFGFYKIGNRYLIKK
jgi:hypothetical protein